MISYSLLSWHFQSEDQTFLNSATFKIQTWFAEIEKKNVQEKRDKRYISFVLSLFQMFFITLIQILANTRSP